MVTTGTRSCQGGRDLGALGWGSALQQTRAGSGGGGRQAGCGSARPGDRGAGEGRCLGSDSTAAGGLGRIVRKQPKRFRGAGIAALGRKGGSRGRAAGSQAGLRFC